MQLVEQEIAKRVDHGRNIIVAEVPAEQDNRVVFPRLLGDDKLWEFNLETGSIERVYPSKSDMILSPTDMRRGMKVKYFIKKPNCTYINHSTKLLATKKLKKKLGLK